MTLCNFAFNAQARLCDSEAAIQRQLIWEEKWSDRRRPRNGDPLLRHWFQNNHSRFIRRWAYSSGLHLWDRGSLPSWLHLSSHVLVLRVLIKCAASALEWILLLRSVRCVLWECALRYREPSFLILRPWYQLGLVYLGTGEECNGRLWLIFLAISEGDQLQRTAAINRASNPGYQEYILWPGFLLLLCNHRSEGGAISTEVRELIILSFKKSTKVKQGQIQAENKKIARVFTRLPPNSTEVWLRKLSNFFKEKSISSFSNLDSWGQLSWNYPRIPRCS